MSEVNWTKWSQDQSAMDAQSYRDFLDWAYPEWRKKHTEFILGASYPDGTKADSRLRGTK
jgi:hypothetical protein